MRLTYLDHLSVEPGTLLQWIPVSAAEPAPYPVPPTSAQLHYLAAGGPTTWLSPMFDVTGPIDQQALGAAFERWIARHDALHLCFVPAQDGAMPSIHAVADTDILLRPQPPVLTETSEELHILLGARLDHACNPYRFAPYFLGAISRPERSTVVCGFDHAISDGWSMTIAVAELAELYRAARHDGPRGLLAAEAALPAAASYLSYSARETSTPAVSRDDPRAQGWLRFLRHGAGELPHFPVDLGVEPGTMPSAGTDARTLLDAASMDALHKRCRAGESTVFGALLAAVARASADLSGHRRVRLIFPVHTRREPRYSHTFGWMTSFAPATVSALPDFDDAARAATESIRSGQLLAQVPFGRVLDIAAPELALSRVDMFTVSYLDYRNLPGGSRADLPPFRANNPTQLNRVSRADDVQMWFTRTDDGLTLRTRFPDTEVARPMIRKFLDQLASTLCTNSPI